MTEQPTDFFWEASAAALARSDVATGTMMGFPCLRLSGAFFASCDHRSGDLIVKLPRHRVEQLIRAGAGEPFAPPGRTSPGGGAGAPLPPGGRPFREWVLIGDRAPARGAGLIDEARAFAGGQP